MTIQRGTKRNCQSCGRKYYDLGATDPACPVCGTKYDFEAMLKYRQSPHVIKSQAPKRVNKPVEDDRLPPVIEPDDDLPITSVGAVEEKDVEADDEFLLEVA